MFYLLIIYIKISTFQLACLEVKAKEKLKEVHEILQSVNCLQLRLMKNTDNAKQDVVQQFVKIRENLNLIEAEMLEKIDKQSKRKESILKEQEKELEIVNEKFSIACSFLNKTVTLADDAEVTLIRKIIHERMNELEKVQIEKNPKCNDEISKEDLKFMLKAVLKS